jgi:hypothetical protein
MSDSGMNDEIKQILHDCLQSIEEKTGNLYMLSLDSLSGMWVNPIVVGELPDRPGRYRVVMQKKYSDRHNKDHTLYRPKKTPENYLMLNGEYDTINDIKIKIKEMNLHFWILRGRIVTGRHLTTTYGNIQIIK